MASLNDHFKENYPDKVLIRTNYLKKSQVNKQRPFSVAPMTTNILSKPGVFSKKNTQFLEMES